MTARKVTVATLSALKARSEKAVFVTAYDYPTATFADRAGVDMILVGDSAAMTMLGLPTTLGIGLDEMLVFARAVTRAARRAFVVGDLPFLSYQPSDETAIRSAGAFVAAGCDAVKCEGGARVARRVRAMVDAGIGAGPGVDGQLVISHDILGNFVGDIAPRFVKRYAEVGVDVERAFREYARDVRAGAFPGPEHCYPIDPADEADIRAVRQRVEA